MRTDHPTAPITPADTQQIHRWPVSNVIEPSNTVIEPSAATGRWNTPIESVSAPLPAVGDPWGLDDPDPIDMSNHMLPRPVATPPVVMPYVPPRSLRPSAAPAANAALWLSLISIPLVLVFGIGAVTGLISIGVGAYGIRKIRRTPHYTGNGRCITGIVLGTGSVLCGTPILLLSLLVAAVF